MIKVKRLISFVCCIIFLGMLVCAEENYSGYIVKLKDECTSLFGSLYALGEQQTFDAEYTAELLAEEIPDVGMIYAPEGLIKANDDETLQYLIDLGVVEYSEPDLICELYGYTPEDNAFYNSQWALEAVNAEYAWNVGAFGQGIKVAVIDSGVKPHPDLGGVLLPGANYEGITEYSPDIVPGTDTTDNLWHGTFVAGIIAAQCNDIGVVGLAHNVKIVPIKVCDTKSFNISYLIPAIRAAVDDFDCDVINLSLGYSKVVTYKNGKIVSGNIPTSQAVSEAISYAVNKGCIVVAASGNDTDNLQSEPQRDEVTGDVIENRMYSIPASFSNVISVGNAMVSVDQSVSKYDIAPSSVYNEFVDVAAPGTSVHSTHISAASGYGKGNGTSFSAPYVSAAAAIMKSIDPSINYSTFNSILRYCSDNTVFPDNKNSNHYGAGLLDMEALIDFWLSRKYSSGYLSPIDIQNNEYNSSVYVHNTTDASADYTVVITDYYGNEKTVAVTVAAGSTYEISLTELGFKDKVDVSLYVGSELLVTRSATIPQKAVISYDKESKTATIECKIYGTYTIVFADYDEYGKLNAVDVQPVTVSKDTTSVPTNLTLDEDDSIMLFSELDKIKPLCEACIIE